MSAASVEGEADDSSAGRTVIFGTGVTDHLLQQQGRGRQQDSGEEQNQIKPQKKGKSVAKNWSHLFLRCPKPPKQTFNHPRRETLVWWQEDRGFLARGQGLRSD